METIQLTKKLNKVSYSYVLVTLMEFVDVQQEATEFIGGFWK